MKSFSNYFYSGTDMKRVHRELAALMKNLHSQFDGQVKLRESTFEFDSDDGLVIHVTICPNVCKISKIVGPLWHSKSNGK